MKTLGWEPTCSCKSEVIPCTVMDVFVGSGTTCQVAISLGRRSIGIDLSEEYLQKNAIPRIQGELLSVPSLAPLAGIERKRVTVGRAVG